MDKYDQFKLTTANLHTKASTCATDISTLAPSKPKTTRHKRYIDKNYLQNLHQIPIADQEPSDMSYSLVSDDLSKSTRNLIAQLYRKYVVTPDVSSTQSYLNYSDFVANQDLRPSICGDSHLSFQPDSILFAGDQFTPIDWEGSVIQELSVIDSNEEQEIETSEVEEDSQQAREVECIPETSSEITMFDSNIALQRAQLAGITVKPKRFYSQEFKNFLLPQTLANGRCKLNVPPKLVKPPSKQVEESIDTSVD